MKRKRKGGILDTIINTIWVLIVAGTVLAGFQIKNIEDIGSAIARLRTDSNKLADCVPDGSCSLNLDVGGKTDGGLTIKLPDGKVEGGLNLSGLTLPKDTEGLRGPEFGEPYVLEEGAVAKENAMLMLRELRIEEPKDVEYSRREWKHWDSIPGRSCWNVRKEVLYRDAVPGSLKFTDKSKNPTNSYEEACAIGTPVKDGGKVKIDAKNSGKWIDPYSGEEMTDASKIDIDHVIPLSYVAKHGGQEWPEEKKREYANDYSVLLATSARENRTKGDKGPSEYMPPYKPYRCAYAKTFTTIAYKYDISVTEKDAQVLSSTIAACAH